MVGKNFSGKQMSEAFINSAFLALSGGFQDAYTYNTRNEVFSNAQTGNVVLMSSAFYDRRLEGRSTIFAASYSICSWSFRGRSDSDAV